MSELIRAINKRRAFRGLSEQAVPKEVQERIVTAATYAPSCFNNQPWRFVLVDEPQSLEAVREHLKSGNYWAKKAPMYVLVVTKPDLDCDLPDRRQYALYDSGFAAMNMILQATEEGLIAHPIAGYSDTGLKKHFGIPDEYILLNVIVFGYPGDDSQLNEKHRAAEHATRSRKPMDEVISRNGWPKSSPNEAGD